MARQQGITTQFAGAWESAYGTAPASGYFELPFIRHTLGAEHGLEEDDTISGRRELAPEKGATTAGGEVVVPLEAESIGFWLRALFREPTTTGTGPYTHVFEAGSADSLPSLSLEAWMSRVPYSDMTSGAMADTLAVDLSPEGKLQATIGMIARSAVAGTTSNAGTPGVFGAFNRFPATSAALKRNGAALTSKGESGVINVSNSLDALRGLDGTGLITDMAPGRSLVTGTVTLRFADQTMLTQAIDHGAATLETTFAAGGGEALTFLMHEVYLDRPKVPIEGPQGIQATFSYRAVRDMANGKQMTVTLVNNTASYA